MADLIQLNKKLAELKTALSVEEAKLSSIKSDPSYAGCVTTSGQVLHYTKYCVDFRANLNNTEAAISSIKKQIQGAEQEIKIYKETNDPVLQSSLASIKSMDDRKRILVIGILVLLAAIIGLLIFRSSRG